MEVYVIIGVVVLILLIFFISGKVMEYRKKKLLREILLKDFGILPDSYYIASDFERIRKYHHKNVQSIAPDHFCIDDTTWNDLNMDDVFSMFNVTQSSVG